MHPIRALTIHCSATPEGRDVTAEQLNQWAQAKFGQRSYHWIVLLDGRKVHNIIDGHIGAHTGGRNTGNIGVVYVGGMSKDMKRAKDTRTPAQKKALREIVADYRAKYPGIKVLGHRDWPKVAKDCPSFDVATQL